MHTIIRLFIAHSAHASVSRAQLLQRLCVTPHIFGNPQRRSAEGYVIVSFLVLRFVFVAAIVSAAVFNKKSPVSLYTESADGGDFVYTLLIQQCWRKHSVYRSNGWSEHTFSTCPAFANEVMSTAAAAATAASTVSASHLSKLGNTSWIY